MIFGLNPANMQKRVCTHRFAALKSSHLPRAMRRAFSRVRLPLRDPAKKKAASYRTFQNGCGIRFDEETTLLSTHPSPMFKTLLALTILGIAATRLPPSACGVAADLEVFVPAYFYPSLISPWNDLNAAAEQVDVTAIMNPSSGPGTARDPNYADVVDALRDAGGRVIGYVPSGYGQRPLAEVLGDIDRYQNWYSIDGIFLDEMSNSGAQAVTNYYSHVYTHVKTIDPSWELVGNPGTNTRETFLTLRIADRLVVSENGGSAYPAYTPSTWNFDHDRSRFIHLIHGESSADNMREFLDLAVSRNAGGIYITDDVLPNPWDRLPSYWQEELSAISEINAAPVSGDFDLDGDLDCADVNALVANIQTGIGDNRFDLTTDELVNDDDLSQWLTAAGWDRGFSAAIRVGDANLDGRVNAADFNIVGLHWQNTSATGWCSGDFDHDGAVDAADLNALGLNWQTDITPASAMAIPEPATQTSLLMVVLVMCPWWRRRRRTRECSSHWLDPIGIC
jgi:hypothetical protein